jgi:hypothetical protein
MKHSLLITAAVLTLAACQPKQELVPASEAAAPETETSEAARSPLVGWDSSASDISASLSWIDEPGTPPFQLVCTKENAMLSASAAIQQVGIGNIASPYALILAGQSFEATAIAGLRSDDIFAVQAPVTPELLKALRDSETARISVNEGYAFAESGMDDLAMFDGFVDSCAAITGITPAP